VGFNTSLLRRKEENDVQPGDRGSAGGKTGEEAENCRAPGGGVARKREDLNCSKSLCSEKDKGSLSNTDFGSNSPDRKQNTKNTESKGSPKGVKPIHFLI